MRDGSLQAMLATAMRCPTLNRAARLRGLCAIGVLLSCTSAPRNTILPGHEDAPGVDRVLLLPPNVAVSLAPELEDAVEPVQEEIAAFLVGHDRSVQRLSFGQARREWAASIDEVKAAGQPLNFERTVVALAERLSAKGNFEAIVMPMLVSRSVSLKTMRGRWDGVTRRFPTHNEPRLQPGQSGGFEADRLWGSFRAASLRVMVFARDGCQVFEGRGGLDFVDYADMTHVRKRATWTLHPRDDFLEDHDIVREAVELAFDPYLGHLDR